MADARIDSAIVLKLIVAQLATALGGIATLVGPNEPEPASPWTGGTLVRLLSVDLTPRTRQQCGSEPDTADAIVRVQCRVALATVATSLYAAAAKVEPVRAALDEVRLADATTTHSVQFDRATAAPEPASDDQRGMAVCVLVATATVTRVSGTSLTPFPA